MRRRRLNKERISVTLRLLITAESSPCRNSTKASEPASLRYTSPAHWYRDKRVAQRSSRSSRIRSAEGVFNSPSVATNLADAALVHLHTHSGWPVQRGPSILAQCGVTSRLRTQKTGHGLNEQTISQLWGIHQKAKVAEEFQPNGLRASRCPRWRPEPSTTKNPAGKPAG